MEEVKTFSGSGTGQDVERKLILFNSSHFWEEVITQLQKATGFDLVHCEQIAIIAHTKGKAVVKSGDMEDLMKIESILKEINLVTKIE
ncbi:MAG: ATP-dependent Clp protease adaptor ClpS [Ignavibacteriaceae bacterium]|nr:ATP-dependent Clp protease adaptor ClpS [Ignavibacteriaceae bacterium]